MKDSKPLNLDGLINGLIPKGKLCPWFISCLYKQETCPTPDHLQDLDVFCVMAIIRSIATVDTSKNVS